MAMGIGQIHCREKGILYLERFKILSTLNEKIPRGFVSVSFFFSKEKEKKREKNSPPLILPALQRNKNAAGDELADDPAQVDVAGEVVAQGHGADLGRVRDGHGLEDAPGHALEQLADEEDGQAVGEEGEEDEARHGDERGEERPPVPPALAENACDLEEG